MAYPVKAVANAILKIAAEHGADVSPLKLQKLTYISHGWHLGLTEKPLISDELPEAWQYGPVFPSLYHEFKQYGRGPIKERATDFSIGDDGSFIFYEALVPDKDEYAWRVMRKVWDAYGKYGAVALSDLTHRQGTPWQQIWSKSGGIKNVDIGNDLIMDHYRQLTKRRTGAK